MLSNYFEQEKAEKQKKELDRLLEAQSEILRFSELDRFIEGFQLGAKLMLDSVVLPHESVIRDIH